MNTLSSHQKINIIEQRLQPYLNDIHTWTQQNNLQLNADKSTATLFTPDPAEYNTEINLTINNDKIPTIKNPKILGLTLDPKLNFSEHTKITKTKADKSINLLKALTTTKWGKQKETIISTYKTITRPILEYASTIWSPITDKHLNHTQTLQTIQNKALRIATGCVSSTNTQHLHQETNILPIETHLRLHASQYRAKCQELNHPLNHLLTENPPPRKMKETIFNNTNYTTNIPPNATTPDTIKQHMKTTHTQIVTNHIKTIPPNKILNAHPPEISQNEELLDRKTRCTLAQLRTGKSPFLNTYLNTINPTTYPSPNCPLCQQHKHTTQHLFNCPKISTTLTPWICGSPRLRWRSCWRRGWSGWAPNHR